jgi:hypothetical protein
MDFTINKNGEAVINWEAAAKMARGMDNAVLQFAINDCRAAVRVHPTGHKAGYYQDFIHVCIAEQNRRK